MRVLILGAAGMLGHKLFQTFRDRFETWATVRARPQEYARFPMLDPERLLGGTEATDLDSIMRALARVRPDAVINCIGVIKQLPTAKDPLPSIKINALFPHQLAQFCQAAGARLIHISTDCVFSGRRGHYTEDDFSDAEDLYGRTKFLGEVSADHCLTLRTSIIGRELQTRSGLVEWFITQRGGRARGFAGAIYTGLTTATLADLIGDILEFHPTLSGLWQVAAETINKYELLNLINDQMGLGVAVERDDDFRCDRSLDGSRFRAATGFRPPSWHEMISRMAADSAAYDELREKNLC